MPADVPLHRTRIERFEDLVMLAVSQLEPRWETELSAIGFAVEEIPPVLPDGDDPEPVPLARLEPEPSGPARPAQGAPGAGLAGSPDFPGLSGIAPTARIVLYRRPLMARADGEEELAELVLDVIVEQFARWLGVDPQTIDPGYPSED